MIPRATRFMRTFVPLFKRPVWASQEQLMNLGKSTFPSRLTSGMHDLLVFFSPCMIVGFPVTNNHLSRLPSCRPRGSSIFDHERHRGRIVSPSSLFYRRFVSAYQPDIEKRSSIRSWEWRRWPVNSESV